MLLLLCLFPFHFLKLFMGTGFNSSVLAGLSQAGVLLAYAIIAVTLQRRGQLREWWKAVLVRLAFPALIFGTNVLFGTI